MKMKKFSFIPMLFVWMLCACAPANKEAYLADYKEFMNNLADERKDYGDVQWKKAKAQFKLYSDKWYNEFEEELTTGERLLLAGYETKFAYFYAAYEAREAIDDVMQSLRGADRKSLRATIQEYVDKDLDDDLEDLYDEAKEIGGETLEIVEELFDELDIKH